MHAVDFAASHKYRTLYETNINLSKSNHRKQTSARLEGPRIVATLLRK